MSIQVYLGQVEFPNILLIAMEPILVLREVLRESAVVDEIPRSTASYLELLFQLLLLFQSVDLHLPSNCRVIHRGERKRRRIGQVSLVQLPIIPR